MIGIVILNYQNYEVTKRCVQSILVYSPYEDFKIFIVDNGSTNESFKVLTESYDEENIVIRRIEENVGFAAGNDYGISLCENDGIDVAILANSDILFNQGSIEGICNSLRTEDKAVIVGPKVYWGGDKAHRVMHSSRLKKVRLIDPLEIGRFFPTQILDEENKTGVHKVWSVSGCCFGVNIARFRGMGGFDKNTFLYNEENILGMQAKAAGLSTYINLNISVIHEHGASSGKENDFVRTEYIKSTLYYWSQYRGVRRPILDAILLAFTTKLKMQGNPSIHPKEIYQRGKDYLIQLSERQKGCSNEGIEIN